MPIVSHLYLSWHLGSYITSLTRLRLSLAGRQAHTNWGLTAYMPSTAIQT